MKKLLLISTVLTLTISTPIFGQIRDATEQSKRRGRTQFHIEKEYKGKVVKILFGRQTFGGALNGFVFERPNGTLLHVDVPSYYGKEVGPLLRENEEIEIKVTGDELLLEEIFSKNLYRKKIEVALKRPLSGMANIAEIKSPRGNFSINDIDINERLKKHFSTTDEAILDAKVVRRIRLRDKEGILVLDNDDSLVFFRSFAPESVWNQNQVSYLRTLDESSPAFYKSPKVHRMTTGNPVYVKTASRPNTHSRLFGFGNAFLKPIDVEFVDMITNKSGFISGFRANTKRNKLDTFWFEKTNAKQFQTILKQSRNDKIKVYFQEFPDVDFVRAIRYKDQVVKGYDKGWRKKDIQPFLPEKISFTGKISEIQYAYPSLKSSFRNIILEDSIYISVSTVVALSIAKQIEKGKEISFDGWVRTEHPDEINIKGYTRILPHKITIDGITFTNHSSKSNSL